MDVEKVYTLEIEEVQLDKDDDGHSRVTVKYAGRHGSGTVSEDLNGEDMANILECCQSISRKIFKSEFRMNAVVDLSFELRDHSGISIWHTQPNMFLKFPLNMTMHWSCDHLRKNYKTFTTLGMVQAPEEIQFDGNKLETLQTLRLTMDSMATGVEFMGTIMYMRDHIDHDKESAESVG